MAARDDLDLQVAYGRAGSGEGAAHIRNSAVRPSNGTSPCSMAILSVHVPNGGSVRKISSALQLGCGSQSHGPSTRRCYAMGSYTRATFWISLFRAKWSRTAGLFGNGYVPLSLKTDNSGSGRHALAGRWCVGYWWAREEIPSNWQEKPIIYVDGLVGV